ncbi:MAG: hypothetical protein F6K18_27215 [Okeania sp. SIO2C2]|uniref:hypothetical protein n=1 Tax=Okeania sp. SIO2C2 TaxID=2607787 RepID=UPI0013B667C2|nr:hypothetical protein [Okeania sp. SIO2C2]NEP90219.1 hypothetical protein [Okeania sp. SIO2C2]
MLKEPLLKTKNFLRNVRNYQKIPNWYWVDKIPKLNMSFNDVEVERGSDKLFLKPLDIYVEKEKHDFLLLEEGDRRQETGDRRKITWGF